MDGKWKGSVKLQASLGASEIVFSELKIEIFVNRYLDLFLIKHSFFLSISHLFSFNIRSIRYIRPEFLLDILVYMFI